MKRSQIKELAHSAVEYGDVSDNDMNWIFSKLSRPEMKLLMRLLKEEIRVVNVIVHHAGDVNADYQGKIISSFPGRKVSFKRDDENIEGGLRIEYGDFVWDYSVAGIVRRILNNIRESL